MDSDILSCGLVVVRAVDFDPWSFRFNLGQVVHMHMPLFTKQYKLVPVKGRKRSVTGKVTAGSRRHVHVHSCT